jgi:superfamily II DNA or RNA helicase
MDERVSIPAALTRLFPRTDRLRGEQYARTGRVRLDRVTPESIRATVRGSAPYHVEIAVATDGASSDPKPRFSCTCPQYAQAGRCKHIWAALSAASEQPASPFDAFRTGAPASSLTRSSTSRFLKEATAGLGAAGRPVLRPHRDGLIYAFNLAPRGRDDGITLEVLTRDRKRNGAWGPPRPPHMSASDLDALPPRDAEILSVLIGALQAASRYGSPYALPSSFAMSTAIARVVIPMVAATGRAHLTWGGLDPALVTPVAWDDGPPWTFVVSAERTGAMVTVQGQFVRGDESLPPNALLTALESGFVITKTSIARAILPTYRSLFAALLKHGIVEISEADASALAESLARAGVASPDLPEILQVPSLDIAPIRRLSMQPARGWTASRDQLEAIVSFDYGGVVVAADGPLVAWDRVNHRVIRRRAQEEADALDRLETLGVRPIDGVRSGEPAWSLPARSMPGVVRALVSEGWFVEIEGRRFQGATRVSLAVTSGIDWFDLQASVDFAGETAPLAEVLASLKRGDHAVRLGDGSMGLLPEDWLARYAPLAALGDVDGDRLRFSLPQAAILDALLEAQGDDTSVTIDATFAAARQTLRHFDTVEPADPPPSFRGVLRPYQREGLGWLEFLRRFGFGGCLADDMGLGKTVMVLAMLDAQRARRAAGEPIRRSLVVAPRSVVHNWIAEAARFAPDLRIRDHSQTARPRGRLAWNDADVAIVTYGTLRRDIDDLKDQEFDYVVLDEAQAIKNASTSTAKAARLLRAQHRLALSGTPIENHLGELWSLFEFLNPGLLGRSPVFAGVNVAARSLDPDTATLLARGVRPFVLRRTKAQVATDLPARTEQTILCDLEPRQRAFYNALRQHYRERLLGRVDRLGLRKSTLQVLEALLRLRQAACHPALVDAAEAHAPSAKLEMLLSRLREVTAEGHKALVFSQFTSFLAIVRTALDKEGLVYEYLDGRTRDRETRVARFQTDPACPLFLISLKAGGVGLNLTAADYVFLLDPWWNPAVEAQAIDRSHRIGQQSHVFAYRLIGQDTVEEKVLELQQTKRSLAEAILRADAGLIGQLRREDLEHLLS